MNVEIGTEATQFPEKEYINGIFLAVHVGYGYRAMFRLNIFGNQINNRFSWIIIRNFLYYSISNSYHETLHQKQL